MAFNWKEEYHRYRHYFFDLQFWTRKKEVVVYTGLALTLFTIAFFGLFALKPTFVTITALLKELQEKRQIEQTLETKISQLTQAQANYSLVADSLPFVDQALPPNLSVSELVYQIEGVAQKSGTNLRSVNFEPIDLLRTNPNEKTASETKEIVFNLTLGGDFENLKTFLASLENLRRILFIDSFSLAPVKTEETQTMSLNLTVKAYYLPREKK